jgi:YesN/AraC family two-component response regulator
MTKKVKNVLFVDDEKDLQIISKFHLGKFATENNINIEYFLSAAECLKYLSGTSNEISLIITDINMPEMDGFELIDEVRKNNEKIIFLIISAYGNKEYLKKAEDMNVSYFFTKPIDFNHLKNEMLSFLSES